MTDVLIILILLVCAFGMVHLGPINGFLWFLDNAEGVDTVWSFDTFLAGLLVPIALIIVAIELYLLYFAH